MRRWGPLYKKFTFAASLSATQNGKTINYVFDGTTSAEAKFRLANGLAQFAGTDTTLSPEQRAQMPDAWLLPSLAQAVVIGYNLPGFTDLELQIPREALAAVFLGRIRMWSELAEWNPRLQGLEQPIVVIVRSDGAGTSHAMTSALSSFSAEWNGKVGVSSKPLWPRKDLQGEGDMGVAMQIKLNSFSIGYLSHKDAATFRVLMARVGNAAGTFVAPTSSSVQSAMDAYVTDFFVMLNGNPAERIASTKTLYKSIADPRSRRKGDSSGQDEGQRGDVSDQAPGSGRSVNETGRRRGDISGGQEEHDGDGISPLEGRRSAEDAYPISMLTYIAFNPGHLNCGQLYDVLYLVYWMLSSPAAARMMKAQFVSPISAAVANPIINRLRSVVCGDRFPIEDVIALTVPKCPAGMRRYVCAPSAAAAACPALACH